MKKWMCQAWCRFHHYLEVDQSYCQFSDKDEIDSILNCRLRGAESTKWRSIESKDCFNWYHAINECSGLKRRVREKKWQRRGQESRGEERWKGEHHCHNGDLKNWVFRNNNSLVETKRIKRVRVKSNMKFVTAEKYIVPQNPKIKNLLSNWYSYII